MYPQTGCLAGIFTLIFILSYTHATIFGYVPTAECSSGCSFNSPIWNVTGVPHKGDDVYISSNVPITIYANHTTIELSSLTFGTGFSPSITFSLNFSSLTCTSGLNWGSASRISHSYLKLYNSNISTSGAILGQNLTAYNGIINSLSRISISQIVGDTINVTSLLSCGGLTAIVNNSNISCDSIIFSSISSSGSSLSATIVNADTIRTVNGSVTASIYFSSLYAQFIDTTVYASYIDLLGSMFLSFTTPHFPSHTFTFGGSWGVGCSGINNYTFYLGDNVLANIYGIEVCPSLILGNNVTLNFLTRTYSPTIMLYGSIRGPHAKINIVDTSVSFLGQHGTINTDIVVMKSGILSFSPMLSINGIISGDGELLWNSYNGILTCSNLTVANLNILLSGKITAKRMRVSSMTLNTGLTSQFVLNVPEVYTAGLDITQLLGNVTINGAYIQQGGQLNFAVFNTLSNGSSVATTAVKVSGGVILQNVHVNGTLPNGTWDQVLIFHSRTQNATIHSIGYESSKSYYLTQSGGDIYAVSGSQANSFPLSYIYLLGGCFVLLFIIIIVMALLLIRALARRKKYNRIN